MKEYRGQDKINGVIWYHYPVLQKYKTVTIFDKGKHHYFRIRIGKQDNIIVAGYSYELETGPGGGCIPGRKWGEYESELEAITDILKRHIKELKERKFKTSAEKDALKRLSNYLENNIYQLKLFPR